MTGEITLRGEVLPIGGLKEKLLAAGRGGIKTVLIPEENVKDLAEIPGRDQEPPRHPSGALDRAGAGAGARAPADAAARRQADERDADRAAGAGRRRQGAGPQALTRSHDAGARARNLLARRCRIARRACARGMPRCAASFASLQSRACASSRATRIVAATHRAHRRRRMRVPFVLTLRNRGRYKDSSGARFRVPPTIRSVLLRSHFAVIRGRS